MSDEHFTRRYDPRHHRAPSASLDYNELPRDLLSCRGTDLKEWTAMEPNRLLDEIATSLNARDWTAYGRLFTSDLVVHAPGLHTTGRDARVKWVQDLVVAFPDGRIAVDRVFAQDDLVCAELRFAGTHTGPMNSAAATVPATNRKVTFPYCLVLRTKGEQIAELHEYFDQLELVTQLGLRAHI